ncbi:MAG: hypothetical protein IT486_05860 [Gammaproteobacteria bacterium]|nr:hypothetical protein [Gammaproteobacteria bacterium]
MSDTDLQELLALGVVVLVVALTLWRRARRRRAGKAGCSGCDSKAARPSGESPLRFHRRR